MAEGSLYPIKEQEEIQIDSETVLLRVCTVSVRTMRIVDGMSGIGPSTGSG